MYNISVDRLFRIVDYLIYLAAALYLVSLFTPAMSFTIAAPATGLNLLEVGWLGLFIGMLAWYANVAAALGFIMALLKNFRAALLVSVAAIVLGSQSFFLRLVPTNEGNFGGCDLGPAMVGTDSCVPVDHLGIGFYLWMLSFILLATHCLMHIVYHRRAVRSPTGL